MSAENFNELMAGLNPPMAIVTTAVGEERAGCLIGFHAQNSIDPSRYCVWISKANHTHRALLHSSHIAIHFLTRDDRDLARIFGELSGDHVDKFALCDTSIHETGVPLLDRCPFRMVGRRVTLLEDDSDHACVIVEPLEVSTGGEFVALHLSDLNDLVPGHPVQDRAAPPTVRAATQENTE
ncbi:MAG: flavin reductase family protein [Acidimicrobiales bacterium]